MTHDRSWRRIGAALSVAALSACGPLADGLDDRLNPVAAAETLPDVPPVADHDAFHRDLLVADLHADTLLWRRDLLADSTGTGHLDVPRMVRGGVDLQVFAVVTKTPSETPLPGEPGRHCIRANDVNTAALLSVVQGRPVSHWFDQRARALHQSERLHEAALRSRTAGGTELRLIENVGDLRGLLADQAAGRSVVGAVLALEGLHWVSPGATAQEVEAEVDRLFLAGFRMLALTHRFDNTLAGSSEGCTGGPLTDLGAVALRRAQALGMVLDLAHISEPALADAVALTEGRPFVVSHGGIQEGCIAPCYVHRNLSPEALRSAAAAGGVVGIGFWPAAVGPGLPSVLAAMDRTRDDLDRAGLRGADHIAFGSDFDGAVEVPFDVTGLPLLTRAMRAPAADGGGQLFTDDEVRRIAGGTVCRLLATRLPGGGPGVAAEICGAAGR